jgi:hypothetical protein
VATGFENISASIAQRFTNAGTTLLNDRTYGYIHITTGGEDMTYETSRTAPFSEGLNGKRVLFVGDSFLYYGRAVLANTSSTEAGRQGDVGYFYQLCKSQGAQVDVVNWTYGGTALSAIMENHIPKFTDYTYDYVVMSAGRNSAATIAAYEETMDKYIEVFRGANPNVKMFMLVTSGAHNISVKESFPMDVLNNLDKIEAKGIRVVDWGKMVADIIRGQVQVPDATQTYDKFSFVHNKTAEDGFHPNQLTGYIVSMFVYCAITGESAVGQPYDFWNNKELHKSFDPVAYMNYGYKLGTSNYQDIFASPETMEGIQTLVDRYMAEKAYLTYNFTEVPQN